jgi:UPF0716 family protein affecting phage T7 exclusion
MVTLFVIFFSLFFVFVFLNHKGGERLRKARKRERKGEKERVSSTAVDLKG